ncbi:MAG: hypothetical protein PHT75_01385 [Bacilli bacterium]|nr:hypothetical protein [Bacilli bacterium]MDD3304768.1 hypothetical protein [Bacilli bacterium]MDD4053790.1 hypothetical protein [Bacilli bacterium]MDD4411636.1 hypothetical protein [Bacilli bacterium]
MDALITDQFYNLLMISVTFSIILMTLIQKLKTLSFMKNNNHVMIADFLLSFLGILFGMYFYDLTIIEGLWVSLFSFIGAPAIYKLLKAQNVINYTPKSLDDCRGCIVIEQENIINREDV